MPRPWEPPETEFPAIVPISTLQFGRSEQSAIAITGMSAYSNGFEIFVTRLIRPDAPGFDGDPVPGAPRGTLAERQSFQISLQLSDGCIVTSGTPHGDAEPTGAILRSRGGGGTSHYLLMRWWAPVGLDQYLLSVQVRGSYSDPLSGIACHRGSPVGVSRAVIEP